MGERGPRPGYHPLPRAALLRRRACEGDESSEPQRASEPDGPPAAPDDGRPRRAQRRAPAAAPRGPLRPRKYTRINVERIDYKDLGTLRRFISDRGKVRSRRVTGLSRRHQKQLALAVKRAREIALLPYVGER